MVEAGLSLGGKDVKQVSSFLHCSGKTDDFAPAFPFP